MPLSKEDILKLKAEHEKILSVEYEDYSPLDAPYDKILKQNKRRIGPKDVQLLELGTDEGADRSAVLFGLGARLLEKGVPFDHAFILLRDCAVNKFSGRHDETQRLYEGLQKAKEKSKVRHIATPEEEHQAAPMEFVRHNLFMHQRHKPPQWLVEGIWAEQGRGLIVAESKSSKSTIAYDLLLSVATGAPFLGHFPVHDTGEVLLIQEEMQKGEVQARGRRMMAHKGVEDGITLDMTNGEPVLIDHDVPLTYVNNPHFTFTDEDQRNQVEAWVAANRPKLICFDPLQYMLGGLNINSQQEMTPVLRWLDYIWDEYSTGIILVHHLNKGREDQGPMDPNRILGSQALRAWHQCLLMLRRDGNKITVAREFRSFQENPFSFTLDWGDEDDPLYEIEVKGGLNRIDALLELVEAQPGITALEAAEQLKISRPAVVQKAKRLKLVAKKIKPPKGTEGRPRVGLYPPRKGR